MKRHAFTLIELLVVVAIIMLLAALLLPALKSGRAKAHQASCASQLKQIGIATTLYVSEFGETLPMIHASNGCCGPPDLGPDFHENNTFLGYLNTRQTDLFKTTASTKGNIFRCPTERECLIIPWLSGYGATQIYCGYAGNSAVSGRYSGYFHKITEFRATEVLWFADGGGGTLYRWFLYNGDTADVANYRHNNGVNALYLDGHVAWYKNRLPSSGDPIWGY